MTLTLFVGPKKTGTSWLHHVASGGARVKELRYPARWGRSFVYQRFVRDEAILIWPYLLHERDCLEALLDDLETSDREVRVIVSVRDDAAWTASMHKFLGKYGLSSAEAREETERERLLVADNLRWLRERASTETVRIIDPGEEDLRTMSDACHVPVTKLRAALGERVYESSERSRLPSRRLVELFFRVKPFLPGGVQEVTKVRWLRQIFFRPRENVSSRMKRDS